jgi:2-dehydro-3-deoxygluconokinase
MGRFVSIGECMVEISGSQDLTYRRGYAGDTFNTAWYAKAVLPADWTVDYATALGDDYYSDDMVAFFSKNGIGIGHIRRIAGQRPGLYLIRQDRGDRHFAYWRGESAARRLGQSFEFIANAIAGADIVYFSGVTIAILDPGGRANLLSAVAAARMAGSKIVFDPNERPLLWTSAAQMRGEIMKAAAHADLVLPTFADEQLAFGDRSPTEVASRYADLGVAEIVVKDGGAPATVVANGVEQIIPAVEGAISIDATGAGDSFNGIYIAKRMIGSSVVAAAGAAHAVAARVLITTGALLEPALINRALAAHQDS